jgi:hypothetical protein
MQDLVDSALEIGGVDEFDFDPGLITVEAEVEAVFEIETTG